MKTPKGKPTQPELHQFGVRLKALRKAKGYTSHEAFAYEKGFTRSQVSKYERGYDIRLTSLVRILKALDTTLPEFFSEGFD